MTKTLSITNPKRTRNQNGRSAWYPYYAGFSYDFAHTLIKSAELPKNAIVMDGWNGSGTTTSVANALGHNAVGFDLNPVMVIVAKARLVSKREHSSLEPLAADIIEKASADRTEPLIDEPLQGWLQPDSANDVRRIERAIQLLLVDHDHYETPATRRDFDNLSGIGAFLYLALFRTVRTLLKEFVASNPTWVKTPRESDARLSPDTESIFDAFRDQVLSMVDIEQNELFDCKELNQVKICVANAQALPIEDESIRFVLGSSPYCTRIDYAVATRPELAVLGYTDEKFRELRESLLGTSTVPKSTGEEDEAWGKTCLSFLQGVRQHESRASDTYYYKSHLQYFDGLHNSIGELRRVITTDGQCVLVVQDSYYKNIHNDLAQIVTDMALAHCLRLAQFAKFPHTRTMARVNPGSRAYRDVFTATEWVLVFERTPKAKGAY